MDALVKHVYKGRLPLAVDAHPLTKATLMRLIDEVFAPLAQTHHGRWCWVGAGDARECIVLEKVLAEHITIDLLEINELAVLEGTTLLRKYQSPLRYDAYPPDIHDVTSLLPGTTHVYTVAPAGTEFYAHVLRLACECPTVVRLTMFTRFFRQLGLTKRVLQKYTTHRTSLCGSNEQWQLLSLTLDASSREKLLHMGVNGVSP